MNSPIIKIKDELIWLAGIGTLPLLWWQGKQIRKSIPELPAATDPEGYLSVDSPERLKLLVIGESTAAGVGAGTHQKALAGQLAMYLAYGSRASVQWQAIGRNGITVRALRKQLFDKEIRPNLENQQVDLVVVSLGVNDTKGFTSRRQWRRHMLNLIKTIRNCSDATIILTGLPPLECFPKLAGLLGTVLGARSRMLGRGLQRVAARHDNVHFIPMKPALEPDDLADDGFHPSEKAYSVWGKKLSAYYQSIR